MRIRQGIDDAGAIRQALDWQAQLGQPLFQPRSPAGYADTFADWNGADALLKRIQSAQALAELAGPPPAPPDTLAAAALGPRLDAETAQALRRAESTRAGLALLFASPCFQWRV